MKFSTYFGVVIATLAWIADGHDHRYLKETVRKCGTPIPTEEDRAKTAQSSSKWAGQAEVFASVEIEVFVHVITDTSGNGALTMDNMNDSIDHLKTAFTGTGFAFKLKGATYTENDALYCCSPFNSKVQAMKKHFG